MTCSVAAMTLFGWRDVPAGYPLPPPLIGERFCQLVVLDNVDPSKHGHRQALVRCDCTAEKVVLVGNMRTGATSSCGCVRRSLARVAMNSLHAKHRAGRMPVSSP
jgi:hypothetical protein